MSIPKKNLKGVQDIRTMAGKVEAAVPYKAYMKLSALEMEKFRRGKERESALHRVSNIDARFKEIESEKAELLGFLDDQGGAHFSGSSPDLKVKPQPSRSTGGFKIRY